VWSTIRKQADKSTVVSPHGNVGKPNGRKRKDSDPVIVNLLAWFIEAEKLGETCATRLVREEVGETTVRDHDDKAVYLPMTYGKRSSYRMYCRGQGWATETTKNSGIKKKLIGDGAERKNIVSYASFFNYWMAEFPHIKTSNAREDICNECFIFVMRYKYAAFGNIADEFNSDDDDLSEWSDSEYEDGCRTAAGLKDDLVGTDITLDDEEIVPAGLSNHDVTEEMIMNSVKHVRMAKAQRQYLQRREEEAIDDAKNNVDHSERRYCW
jgi:hypothetical protein